MRLLVDGDFLVYQTCAAVEKEIPVGDFRYLGSNVKDAKAVFHETLYDLMEQANTDEVSFAFSDAQNWRRNVFPAYKANRKGNRKPLCYADMLEYIGEHYEVLRFKGIEADDVLGIFCSRGEYVIWTLDKDLKQIPGLHLVDDEVVEITQEQGDRFHLYQTIIGDVTDGYAGCPGMGPVKANEFLDNPYCWLPPEGDRKNWKKGPAETVWAGIVSLYEKAGLTADDALVQARVARILRDGEFNFETKKVKLWKPV